MQLNDIKSAQGARKNRKRVGRGIGSGLGKTAGRGHKGQRSRSGGYHKVGFEGGQMPLQRRIPKFGFTTQKSRITAEIRLGDLNKITADVVDLAVLKAANLINASVQFVKVFASGELKKAVTLRGIKVTKGAAEAVRAAGGKVEEV